jgi:hypothetical protein
MLAEVGAWPFTHGGNGGETPFRGWKVISKARFD